MIFGFIYRPINKNGVSLFFSAFIGLFWVYSTFAFNFHNTLGFFVGAFSAWIIYTLVFSSVINFLSTLKFNNVATKKQLKWFVPSCFALLIIVWGFYLVCLWPGVLTYDSYTQWGEVNGYVTISEWHPLFHTFLLGLFSKISLSPAPFLIFQIVFSAIAVTYVLTKLVNSGLPFWIVNCIAIGYAIYPMNGIHMSTVWKDVLYSVVLLLMFYFTAEIVRSKGEFIKNWRGVITFALVMMGTALLRKNGYYVVLIAIAFLIITQHSKKIITSSFIALALVFSFNFVTTHVYHAAKSPTTEALAVPMQQIAATYHSGGNIPAEQRKYFDSILPASQWKSRYNEYTVDPIKFSGYFKGNIINDNPKKFLTNWFKLFIHNKYGFLKTYLKQTAFLFKFTTPKNELVSLMGYGLEPKYDFIYNDYQNNPAAATQKLHVMYETYKRTQIAGNQKVISFNTYKSRVLRGNKVVRYDSLFPAGKRLLQHLFWIMQYKVQKYLASGAIGLLVTVLAMCVAFIKLRFWETVGVFLVPALNFLSLIVAAPAPSYRYVYSLCFSAILILFYVLVCKPQNESKQLF